MKKTLIPYNYLIDRLAVLKVKLEKGWDVQEEHDLIEGEVSKKYNLKSADFENLYRINKKMWPMHNTIMESTDDKLVASLARRLLLLNAERADVRSKIAKKFKEYTEYKDYA